MTPAFSTIKIRLSLQLCNDTGEDSPENTCSKTIRGKGSWALATWIHIVHINIQSILELNTMF